MQKRGHLLIASKLTARYKKYKFWIAFGSILPDLLVYTYLKGHTIEAAEDIIMKKICRLEENGTWNCSSCLKLGYILHYVEDFFTYPHNAIYHENLISHIIYEKNQYHYMKNLVFPVFYEEEPENIGKWLKEYHRMYLNAEHGLKTDAEYIFKASGYVMDYFAYIFQRNRETTWFPVLVSLQKKRAVP